MSPRPFILPSTPRPPCLASISPSPRSPAQTLRLPPPRVPRRLPPNAQASKPKQPPVPNGIPCPSRIISTPPLKRLWAIRMPSAAVHTRPVSRKLGRAARSALGLPCLIEEWTALSGAILKKSSNILHCCNATLRRRTPLPLFTGKTSNRRHRRLAIPTIVLDLTPRAHAPTTSQLFTAPA